MGERVGMESGKPTGAVFWIVLSGANAAEDDD
jgi:hypothetical protein